MIRLRLPSNELLERVFAHEAQASVTYKEFGQTKGEMPAGYAHQHLSIVIGEGQKVFEACSDYLDRWQLQRDSGFTIYPSVSSAKEGETILLTLPLLGLVVLAGCRVIYEVTEPARHGFAYGTLPQHAECGEEYFGIFIDDDKVVHFEVRAFSKQQALLAKLGGPISRRLQRRALRTYGESIKAFAQTI